MSDPPDCPAGKKPWRQAVDGPLPLFVPEAQMEEARRRYPEIWIEALPPGLLLMGKALMRRDLGWGATDRPNNS